MKTFIAGILLFLVMVIEAFGATSQTVPQFSITSSNNTVVLVTNAPGLILDLTAVVPASTNSGNLIAIGTNSAQLNGTGGYIGMDNAKIGTNYVNEIILTNSYANGQLVTWGDSLAFNNAPRLQLQTLMAVVNGGVGGDTSSQILTRVLADTNHSFGCIETFWMGRNNYTDTNQVLADISNAVLSVKAPARYIVMSVLNGNFANEFRGQPNYVIITNLNATLASIYGSNYLDVRTTLVAAYNPGIPQDVIDHGNDIPPSSLRIDNIHLTSAGYDLVSSNIMASLNGLYDPKSVVNANQLLTMFSTPPAIGSINPNVGTFSQVYGGNITLSNNSKFSLMDSNNVNYASMYSDTAGRWIFGDQGVSHKGWVFVPASAGSTTSFQVVGTNNNTILDVDTINNRVGIANSVPAYELDVNGKASFKNQVLISNMVQLVAQDADVFRFAGANTMRELDYQPAIDYTSAFKVMDTGNNAVFNVDTTNKRIGINSTSPSYDLDVNGKINAANQILITNRMQFVTASDSIFLFAGANAQSTLRYHPGTDGLNAFQVQKQSDNSIVLDVDTANKRVGVNNSSPSFAFDVSGVGHFTSSLIGDAGWYQGSSTPILTPGQHLTNITDIASSTAVAQVLSGTNAATIGQHTSDNSVATNGYNVPTIGKGITIKAGANGKLSSTAETLSAGTVVVNNTSITANSKVFLQPTTVSPVSGVLAVTAKSVGTSFTVTSSNNQDTNQFSWFIVEAQ